MAAGLIGQKKIFFRGEIQGFTRFGEGVREVVQHRREPLAARLRVIRRGAVTARREILVKVERWRTPSITPGVQMRWKQSGQDQKVVTRRLPPGERFSSASPASESWDWKAATIGAIATVRKWQPVRRARSAASSRECWDE